jgi:hypothetical protein
MSVHGPMHNAHGTRQYMSDKDIKKSLTEQATALDPKGAAEGLAESLLECSVAGASLLGKERTAFLKDLVGNLEAISAGVLGRVKGEPELAGEHDLFKGQFKTLEKALNASLTTKGADPVQPFLRTLAKHQWDDRALEPLVKKAKDLGLELELELERGKEQEQPPLGGDKGVSPNEKKNSQTDVAESSVTKDVGSKPAAEALAAAAEQLQSDPRFDPERRELLGLLRSEFEELSKEKL